MINRYSRADGSWLGHFRDPAILEPERQMSAIDSTSQRPCPLCKKPLQDERLTAHRACIDRMAPRIVRPRGTLGQ